MGNLLAYSGTTTKIRAIRSRLLSPEQYQDLAASSNVTEALTYLKKQDAYQDLFDGMDETSLHRGDIEKILTNAIYIDFQKIYRFSSVKQREFLDLYFHRYEVALLKTCLRMVFDHRNVTLDLKIFEEFFQKHSDIDLAKISASGTIEEFVANLKGSIYYNALNRLSALPHPTLWDYEMAIDLFYFKWFYKTSGKVMQKRELSHFREAYGIKMDLLNMNWIYRSKHYFKMSSAEIYAHLIPVEFHLRKNEIAAMTEAATREELAAAISCTYYGKHFEECTIDTLDAAYTNIRQKIQHKAAAKDPYSIATVISYLFEKEHEIDKITTALECVRYGLPQSQILDYIIPGSKGHV